MARQQPGEVGGELPLLCRAALGGACAPHLARADGQAQAQHQVEERIAAGHGVVDPPVAAGRAKAQPQHRDQGGSSLCGVRSALAERRRHAHSAQVDGAARRSRGRRGVEPAGRALTALQHQHAVAGVGQIARRGDACKWEARWLVGGQQGSGSSGCGGVSGGAKRRRLSPAIPATTTITSQSSWASPPSSSRRRPWAAARELASSARASAAAAAATAGRRAFIAADGLLAVLLELQS